MNPRQTTPDQRIFAVLVWERECASLDFEIFSYASSSSLDKDSRLSCWIGGRQCYLTAVSEARIVHRKRVNRDISQLATKARKYFKLAFCVKVSQKFMHDLTTTCMLCISIKLHILRKRSSEICTVCAHSTINYIFFVKGAQRFTQYSNIFKSPFL